MSYFYSCSCSDVRRRGFIYGLIDISQYNNFILKKVHFLQLFQVYLTSRILWRSTIKYIF